MTSKDEFGTGLEGLADLAAGGGEAGKAPKKARAPRKAAAKAAPKKSTKVAHTIDHDLSAVKVDRSDWPVVVIDEQEGKPNFEFVGVNGKGYQIQRGVATPVPPEVLHVLENAIAARMIQFHNPVTQRTENKMVEYPSIPYRVVKYPKQ